MTNSRVAPPQAWRQVIAASLLLSLLFFAGGCKTSDDAAAAATQLTQTASQLSSYYSALDALLSKTDQLNALHETINPVAQYDAKNKALIADTRTEIQKREALANDLTMLAQEFAKLSGSSSPSDVVTAAGKLESSVEALKVTSFTPSTIENDAMKDALHVFVQAVQERKEREAAQAIDKFATAFATLFQTEEPNCNSIGHNYAVATQSVAKTLLDKGQVDVSASLSVALAPYDLTPQLTDPNLKGSIIKLDRDQLAQKSDALAASQKSASDSMLKALQDMASRIHLVATDKPMAVRVPPVTLANVEKWVAAVLPD